jgi:hypothetical protein
MNYTNEDLIVARRACSRLTGVAGDPESKKTAAWHVGSVSSLCQRV